MTARKHPILSIEQIAEVIRMDAASGLLFWKDRPRAMFRRECDYRNWNANKADSEAMISLDHEGYKSGEILGQRHLAHRVVWALAHGSWPEKTIDHIDGDKTNNRIGNLRDVTNEVNNRNKRKRSGNPASVMGVCQRGESRWIAYIYAGRRIHLGSFSDFTDAVAARKSAEIRHGYHINHGQPA